MTAAPQSPPTVRVVKAGQPFRAAGAAGVAIGVLVAFGSGGIGLTIAILGLATFLVGQALE